MFLFQQDTARQDSVQEEYVPTNTPTYRPTYRFGDPFSNRVSQSPLLLKDPSSLDFRVEFDTGGVSYSVYENLSEVNFRPATSMTFQEFDMYTTQQINKQYWKDQSAGLDGESAVSGRRLIPKLYISPVFDRIFGGDYIDIQPTGFANLDFGGRWQFVDNPAVPQNRRRNGGFNFNMQLSTNVVGKIGEKLAVTFNFDNNNTFDFQNNMKIEYTGYDEDIIKKIEVGNVSMSVENSLITGAQSLFGVKTQLQFGKLFVTGIASRQQGRAEVISVGGGQGITNSTSGRGGQLDPADNINIPASGYDENRHFFLSQYFRDNYERWHRNIPVINSGLDIQRVDVYTINRQNDTESTRNFVGLQDLAEGDPENAYQDESVIGPFTRLEASNTSNNLFQLVRSQPSLAPDAVRSYLDGIGFQDGTDYVVVTTARKLDPSEYIVNKKLGYISLQRRLQNDEVIAVAYTYSLNGQIFKVGEMIEDYPGRPDDQVVILKMLRPNRIATNLPMWDLMMKNIYNLRTTQIQQEGFSLRIHYKDDRTGQDNPSLHEGRITKDVPLLQLMGLDSLNRNGDRQRDGNFDFVDGITIDTRNGNIIFPVVEPFGSNMERFFDPQSEAELIRRYVYDTLYRTTKTNAEQVASQNKYVILGSSQGTVSNIIPLNGFNISQGSVTVMAGGTILTEGLHYDVDYNLGQVRIRDDAILNSGQQITVSYEKADLFNFQTRWLTGAHLDYRVSDNFNIGATILKLNERPGGISRFAIGDEPSKNTKYGMNVNWRDESRLVTKIVDALPLISTKEASNISFNAEIARLVPGTSNIVNGTGTSYIDDFENATIPVNMGSWPAWRLATTPPGLEGNSATVYEVNDRKAKIAWYTVDNSVFYQGQRRPDNITTEDLENHYMRAVLPQEIFTQRDRTLATVNQPIFDIAYYPGERGPYNFNPNLRPDGNFPQESAGDLQALRDNWAGITRAITTNVDFQAANTEYIEFWLLDPFIGGEQGRVIDGVNNENNTTGGRLVFHLGSLSEELIPDGLHAFENGLPEDGDRGATRTTEWGRVTTNQFLTNVFVNDPNARSNQDVGLDGMSNADEQEFLNYPPQFLTLPDPTGDDFSYYLGSELDQRDAKILERYKGFNGLEGNSPVSSGGSFTPASTQVPDNEDLNNDNTISSLEEFFEYEIRLRPNGFNVGEGFIIDEVETIENARWYLFRIPIRNLNNVSRVVGSPSFQNIKYIRMVLTGFRQPVVLRMAQFQLVGSQWRKSTLALNQEGLNEIPESTTSDFDVSVVNIEENGARGDGIPYVVPPGLQRDRDNTTTLNRVVNEQSLQLCIEDLQDRDSRAVFKTNLDFDLINYGRLNMFLHAQAFRGDDVQDDELTGFLRIGSDENENYYEIEVPLKITPQDVTGVSQEDLPRFVWPLENEISVSINELLGVKSQRNLGQLTSGAGGNDSRIPFTVPSQDGKYLFTVKGNPDISNITTMLIGVRNPGSDDRESKSVCIWANELRVTDFDTQKGWAANARLNLQLADLGSISASTRYTSFGFGSIQDKISQRTRFETFQYDVSASINVDKFLLPEKTGLKVPMFASYQQSRSTPQYDPLDPDTPLEASIQSFATEQERDEYRRIVEDRRTSRSLNFTNVRKEKVNPDARRNIYDIENFSFTYAYSDIKSSNVNQQAFLQKTIAAGFAYNYTPPTISIEPFANTGAFNSPFLKLIKDINFSPIPNNLSLRMDLNRSFRRTQLYDDDLSIPDDPNQNDLLLIERLFTFTRSYNMRWSLFKGLSIDYSARANAVIDEPEWEIQGEIDTPEERSFIWDQIWGFGRMKNFSQDISAQYKLPLDKLPLTDWMSADYRYSVSYGWTAGFVNRQGQDQGNLIPDPNDSTFFGNFINNSRDQTLSGRADFVKLYNVLPFLKRANAPAPTARRSTSRSRANGDNSQAPAVNPPKPFGNVLLRLLMSLRSANVTYGVREGTTLPGFLPTPFLFGLDSGFSSPGWGFVLGSQDPGIRNRAADNGWITRNTLLTSPFEQVRSEDLTLGAAVEPTDDIKIRVDAKRTTTGNYQELFRFNAVDTVNAFQSLTPTRGGSYSLTFLSVGTTFEKQLDNVSPAFNQFVENIDIMRQRLNESVSGIGIPGTYDSLSQDILIPAFLAAYSGNDANTSNTNPFPKIPLPNWRLDYAGLNKLPGIRDVFSSINITHSYRSVYSVSNYINQPLYQSGIELNNSIVDYPLPTLTDPVSGNLVPFYIISQVSIAEQFAPLIGVNVRTKSNLTTRLEYKRDRTLSLSLSNAQVNETRGSEISFDLGYTKDNLKLPFRSRGRTVILENDVTFRMNFSIRDTRVVQRTLEGENSVTNGNKNFQMRPTVSYRLNDQLDLTFYFERTVNDPFVGQFYRANTAFGIQTRLSFAQ